jgi:phosphoribosylaminoimidazole carboxylase PurE protein
VASRKSARSRAARPRTGRPGRSRTGGTAETPRVAVIMGSRSDLEVMGHATATLERLEIPYEVRVVSAHRTPERLRHFAEQAEMRGIEAIIAGAGAAAALAGVTAAHTLLPVLGVPLDATPLRGVDALYATVQMPRGIPALRCRNVRVPRAGTPRTDRGLPQGRGRGPPRATPLTHYPRARASAALRSCQTRRRFSCVY